MSSSAQKPLASGAVSYMANICRAVSDSGKLFSLSRYFRSKDNKKANALASAEGEDSTNAAKTSGSSAGLFGLESNRGSLAFGMSGMPRLVSESAIPRLLLFEGWSLSKMVRDNQSAVRLSAIATAKIVTLLFLLLIFQRVFLVVGRRNCSNELIWRI